MKVELFFAWYDFWIGAYYDRATRSLYVCLLPCVVLKFYKRNREQEDFEALLEFLSIEMRRKFEQALLLYEASALSEGRVVEMFNLPRVVFRDLRLHKLKQAIKELGLQLKYKRDPVDDCSDYEHGPKNAQANCGTDGHYLCAGCKYNQHRKD